jgi:hypothetical protein
MFSKGLEELYRVSVIYLFRNPDVKPLQAGQGDGDRQ